MCKHRRVFPYTLSSKDYQLWCNDPTSAKSFIEGTARKRERQVNRNVALVLETNGKVLAELDC